MANILVHMAEVIDQQETGNFYVLPASDIYMSDGSTTVQAAITALQDNFTSGSVSTALTLKNARSIDGVSFNGSANVLHYGACSTAAGTTEKTVAVANFELITGGFVIVKFTNTNTATDPTLNVNSTGGRAIRYRGSAITAGSLAANRVYMFVYDGTYYNLIGDLDTNTDTDTKVTNTLNTTAKAYITGTTTATTNTGTQVFDTNVYLDTIAGRLRVGSLDIGGAIVTYDSESQTITI